MKSLEFYWGSVSLLCRVFLKDTEINGWSVCDFVRQQVLTRVIVFFCTKLFQYKFIELKEQRIFTQNVVSDSRTNWLQ